MPFTFESTRINGPLIIRPAVFSDERGFFVERFKASDFGFAGITDRFVQDNHSYSVHGVLRGLHFQSPPYAQGKLVSVIGGTVWDVAVDIRTGSETCGQWVGVTLDGKEGTMLYIPPGFAHGFLVLSPAVHFLYKCTAEYNREAESGIRWDDPELNIEWPLSKLEDEPKISEKDKNLPFLQGLTL